MSNELSVIRLQFNHITVGVKKKQNKTKMRPTA